MKKVSYSWTLHGLQFQYRDMKFISMKQGSQLNTPRTWNPNRYEILFQWNWFQNSTPRGLETQIYLNFISMKLVSEFNTPWTWNQVHLFIHWISSPWGVEFWNQFHWNIFHIYPSDFKGFTVEYACMQAMGLKSNQYDFNEKGFTVFKHTVLTSHFSTNTSQPDSPLKKHGAVATASNNKLYTIKGLLCPSRPMRS